MGFRRWNMLEIDGVSKKFGDFYAVEHVHLQLEKGVYGLLGANGAGKITAICLDICPRILDIIHSLARRNIFFI